MAALILDERCVILASFIFFLQIKMQQAISGTSAATYKTSKPYQTLPLPAPIDIICIPSTSHLIYVSSQLP